jgi:holliday junction DNA helicase RuvA
MIASVRGILKHKTPETVIIEVNGIGFEIFISLNTYYKLPDVGETYGLLTYTHVREDCLQLYGFRDENEKKLFHLLQGVSKIGPKLALNILSGTTPEELRDAVLRADYLRISQIPRVGRKTAERIIVELRDKIKEIPAVAGVSIPVADALRNRVDDAIEALMVLGYARKDAESALGKVLAKTGSQDDNLTVESLLKQSLNILTHG